MRSSCITVSQGPWNISPLFLSGHSLCCFPELLMPRSHNSHENLCGQTCVDFDTLFTQSTSGTISHSHIAFWMSRKLHVRYLHCLYVDLQENCFALVCIIVAQDFIILFWSNLWPILTFMLRWHTYFPLFSYWTLNLTPFRSLLDPFSFLYQMHFLINIRTICYNLVIRQLTR